MTLAFKTKWEWVLHALQQGWYIFALGVRSKRPLPGSNGFLDATADASVARESWEAHPFGNIGIATGARSQLLVLDVDLRNGGEETQRKLEAVHGELPETVAVITGSGGGWHFYYSLPAGVTVSGGGAGKLGPGLDVKAEGGYVVAAGSVHPDGGMYAYLEGHAPDEIAVAPAPAWLLAALEVKTAPQPAVPPTAAPFEISQGERNDTLTRIAGSMRRFGMNTPEITTIIEAANAYCSPPLDGAEVQRIAASVSRYPAATSFDMSSPLIGGRPKIEFQSLAAPDFLKLPIPTVPWLVQDLIPSGGLAIVSGLPGAGKSWLGLTLALAIARGEPWLRQFRTTQGTVLLIDEESPRHILHRRLNMLTDKPPVELRILSMAGVRLDEAQAYTALEQLLDVDRPSVIILDSYVRMHGADENSATDIARISARINALRNKFDVTIIIIDHMRKAHHGGDLADRLRGSVEKQAAVDSILSVVRESPRPLRMRVEHSKSRADEPHPDFVVEMIIETNGARFVYAGGAADVTRAQILATVRVGILDVLHVAPSTLDELRDGLREADIIATKADAIAALAQLMEANEVFERKRPAEGRGRPATEYAVPPPEAEPADPSGWAARETAEQAPSTPAAETEAESIEQTGG